MRMTAQFSSDGCVKTLVNKDMANAPNPVVKWNPVTVLRFSLTGANANLVVVKLCHFRQL